MTLYLLRHERTTQMTDPPSDPQSRPDTGNDTARGEHPGLPGWVKVSGIVVAILVMALIVIMLIAGGDHGPGRHATGNQPAEQTGRGGPAGQRPPGAAPFAAPRLV
jgi:hypothetical protein